MQISRGSLRTSLLFVCLLLFFLFVILANAFGQARPRVVEAVDNARRVTLHGNTHPLARPEFDRGAVDDAQPMTRILLLLKRSDEQEAALQDLLEKQQDKSSPSYHAWLTPAEFGEQFGVADADIQAVTQWLNGQGFRVEKVYSNKTIIEFSGTAGQVRNAFATDIRNYEVEGQARIANTSDPQIPAALAPVVAGVVSLNNFPSKTLYHEVGIFHRSKETGRVTLTQAAQPELTFSCGSLSGYCNALVPYDFATIYNVLPLWNGTPAVDGTGQTIALVGESNINLDDVRNFRSSFGLPANDPVIVLNGPDPGLVSGAETEAVLDVEWSGGVARGAKIELVLSQSTEATGGDRLSAEYIVENNLASVMSMSFGQCELFLGTAGNQFFSSLWQQASAQGISVFVSTGDNGAAGCDFGRTTPAPAKNGLQVSGIASTPYNVAVGGTDFSFNEIPYWNTGAPNTTTWQSANGYVPESTWNDSCTNAIFGDPRLGFSTNAETNCNNSRLVDWVIAVGGSGGKSNCTTPTGTSPGTCAGGYAKPSWQTGSGVPTDGKRDIPDVSLFASSGFAGTAYAICEADIAAGPCSYDFLGIGGTSASSPAMAGIMAMVDQKTGSRQGNPNYVLYKLAAKQSASNCNSSASPASTCTFNDVTSGTIAMPCVKSSSNCTTSVSTDQYGILSGYSAGTGYDLATGLGSVNATNLVNNWSSVTSLPSSTTLNATMNGQAVTSITGIAHGTPVSVSSQVSAGSGASGTPTGQVALEGAPNPTPGDSSASLGIEALTLSNGTASGSSVILPGGSYNLTAHYQGDGTFGSSDSAPISVSITTENSKTLISLPTFDPNTGHETGNTPTSLVYGSPYIARIDVGNSQATLSYPPKTVCTPPACPTGSITWTDSVNGAAATPLDGGSFALNNEGYTEDLIIQLSGGSHVLSASYGGDNSFNKSLASYSVTIARAPTSTSEQPLGNTPVEGVPFQVEADGIAQTETGAAPTGTVTFLDGTTQLGSPFTVNGSAGQNGTAPGFSLNPNFAMVTIPNAGSHTLVAQYSGDSNYAPSSASTTVSVLHRAVASISVNPTTVNYGSTVTVTATIDTAVASSNAALKPTGTVSLYGSMDGTITNGLSTTTIADASGNWEIQLTATITPSNSEYFSINYDGDTNYAGVSASSNFLTVVLPDFSMGPDPSYITITAGQSGSVPLKITPSNTLSSTVSFSCNTYIMAGVSCAFGPPSVSLANSASSSTTMTISILPPSGTTTAALPYTPLDIAQLRTGSRQKALRTAIPLFLAMLLLVLSLPRQRAVARFACVLAATLALVQVLGCGGGGGSGGGGGGGGGGGTVPTSVSISVSATKVAATTATNLTLGAKVTSSKAVTGTITFWEMGNNGSVTPPLNIVNGSVSGPASLYSIGTHQIYAQYSGDAQNQGSQSSTINVVATGTQYMAAQGTNGPVSRYSTVWLTVQ